MRRSLFPGAGCSAGAGVARSRSRARNGWSGRISRRARGGLRRGAGRRGQGLREAAELDVDHEDRLAGDLLRRGPERLGERGVACRSLADRRDGGHDHRVARVVGQRAREGRVEVLRCGRRGEVQRGRRAEPFGHARVVGEQTERLGVAEDRDFGAGGQRLAGEQQAGVHQFGDGVDPDHAVLAAAARRPWRAAVASRERRGPAGRCPRPAPRPGASRPPYAWRGG